MNIVNRLEIKVTNVGFIGEEDEEKQVSISYQAIDPNRELNINGRVLATVDEYNQHSSIDKLQDLTRQKVIEKLSD